MKSRMSCCNGALLRRVVTRTALLWGAYLLFWLILLPVDMLSTEWRSALDIRVFVLNNAANSCHIMSFLYSFAVAWFLHLYQFRSRSANFFGALPLRRETVFATNFLAGILCSVVPNFLIMGLTMAAGFANGTNLIAESAIWFAAQTLTYLFYFGLSLLCAMLVGNLVAMPLLYLILNFVAAVVELTLKALLEGLLYGFRFTRDLVMGPFSPLYYAAFEGNGPDVALRHVDGMLTEAWFEGWGMLLILAAVGIALTVGAFFLYKHRRMEVAGDVVAIKALRPVFAYVFTFGCALVGGTVLAEMIAERMESTYFVQIAVCLLIAAVVGYFLGEIILQRTLRVFRKRNFLRCGICAAVVVMFLCCVRLDVLGIEGYVPHPDEVAGVKLQSAVHTVEDPVRIRQVIDLHQEILDRQEETEEICRRGEAWVPRMEITYVLKDGSEVNRSYRLPVFENEAPDPNSLIYKYEEIDNTAEMILARELPWQPMTVENVDDCRIHYNLPDSTYSEKLVLTAEETIRLWQEAMLPDLKAANMGTNYHTRRVSPEPVNTYSDVSVEIELKDGKYTDYYYFPIPSKAVHTMEALIELGVPEEAFFLVDEKFN